MTVASLVYTLALGYQDTPQGRMMMAFGHSIIAASLFIAFYGTGMYYRRLYLMMSKSMLSSINPMDDRRP
jgi:hypothetical protein